MASLAGMLREKGYEVCGSDSDVYPPMSDFLDRLGIKVFKGYNAENIAKAKPELVVIGNALSRGNAEIEYVLDSGIRYASMAETVKDLFIRGKNSIVVAGTHGKTTTTAMLSWLLDVAGRKPSFLVGGIAENFGKSFQVSDGADFVIEGDEYDTAFFDKGPKFLHYLPRIVLLKNVEFDHADIYADLEAIKTAFRRLINIVPRSGLIIAGVDSPVVRELIPAAFSRVATVGLGVGDWRAAKVQTTGDGMAFDMMHSDKAVGSFSIPMSGVFNVQNALGVVVAAKELGRPLLAVTGPTGASRGSADAAEVAAWLEETGARVLMIAGCRGSLLAAAGCRQLADGQISTVIFVARQRHDQLVD